MNVVDKKFYELADEIRGLSEKEIYHRLYPTHDYTPDDWRRYRNAYYRLVETVDAEIGKIIAELDRQDNLY